MLLFGPLACDEAATKIHRLHVITSGGHRPLRSRPVVGSCAAIFWITCRCLASAAARGCGQVEPSARPTSAACTPASLHTCSCPLLPLTSPVRPRHSLTGDTSAHARRCPPDLCQMSGKGRAQQRRSWHRSIIEWRLGHDASRAHAQGRCVRSLRSGRWRQPEIDPMCQQCRCN